VEITLLGRDCFRLKGREAALVTDPFAPMEGTTRLSADIVTVSAEDREHGAVETVEGSPRVVTGPGEYEIKGVLITGVGADQTVGPSKEHTRNTVYLIEIDELRVCHLGALSQPLTTSQVDEIGAVDVLFVPVGSERGFSSTQAAETIAQLEPSIVVPMDWTERDGVLDKFCHEMGITTMEFQPKFNAVKASMPTEPLVVLLEPRR